MYQGSLLTPTAQVPYHHRGSTRLNSSLLTNRVYGLMMSSPYSYTCIRTLQSENHQTRQRVSSHQQSNDSVNGPRRGVKLCAVQSAKVHEWAFGSESPY
ncbi:hypothetical protein AVEN_99543-1 [Araneus ventricosus]|uniref:Uncharacterized protein n=1 Tax=Araneus ventricosus TaxID=182803 RepID=A0A4Y2QM28_ARAVE|nr:hypothetical protein AVEN_99543-1 [Araneus ventricosus]